MVKSKSTSMVSAYYATPTGQIVRDLIAQKLKPILTAPYPKARLDLAIATLGYMRPYLSDISDHYPNLINLDSIGGKIIPWPKAKRSRQALVAPSSLPLLDASLDGLFIMHGLEYSAAPDDMLAEAWRVLKSQGCLVIIVPHRGSIWVNRDDTPFGTGQPYSVNQLKRLLKTHDFEVGKMTQALKSPPSSSPLYPRYAPLVERLPNPFGGVLIAPARKMIYAIRGRPVLERKQTAPLTKGSLSSS